MSLTGTALTHHTGNHPQEDDSDLLLLEPKVKTTRPPMFRVVMLNDDYTPMDFVIAVLTDIFRMSHDEAISTMLQVHHQGYAPCGTYTRDVAETKIEMVAMRASEHEYPLQCSLEQAE